MNNVLYCFDCRYVFGVFYISPPHHCFYFLAIGLHTSRYYNVGVASFFSLLSRRSPSLRGFRRFPRGVEWRSALVCSVEDGVAGAGAPLPGLYLVRLRLPSTGFRVRRTGLGSLLASS